MDFLDHIGQIISLQVFKQMKDIHQKLDKELLGQ